MRFTIGSLHPARIAQYIEAGGRLFFSYYSSSATLHDVAPDIFSDIPNESVVVAGINGLAKQTQYASETSPRKEGIHSNFFRSNSIDRSACALAALIRVSMTPYSGCSRIYSKVSRIDPISQLETLAVSLPCSHPDRKWFLLLVKLARETVIVVGKRRPDEKSSDLVSEKGVWQVRPSPEAAQNLRQRLKQVLMAYRCALDFL